MAGELGTLTAKLAVESASFKRDMGRAAAAVKSESAKMNKAMRGIQRSVNNVKKSMSGMKAVAGALAGALAVRQFTKFTQNALDTADAIGKSADAVGIATKTLQQYRVAGELAGITNDKMDRALAKFTRAIGDARAGTGALTTFLGKTDKAFLNQIKSADSTSEALQLLFDKMAKTKSAFDQNALAAAFFGRVGSQMTVLVRDGAAGFAELTSKAGQFGLIMQDDVIRSAERMNDELSLMKKTFSRGFDSAIIANLAKAINISAESMSEARVAGEQFGEVVGKSMVTLAEGAKIAARNLKEIGAAIAAFVAYKVGAVIGGVVKSMWELKDATKGAATATQFLTRAMKANPIGLLGAAAAVAVGSLLLVNRELDRITDKTVNLKIAEFEQQIKDLSQTIRDSEKLKDGGGMLGRVADGNIQSLERQRDAVQELLNAQKKLLSINKADPFGSMGVPKPATGSSGSTSEGAIPASDAIKKEGQRLTEALDPIAKYNAEVARFKTLHDLGSLSLGNFSKAVQQAQNDMQKALSEAMLPMTAAEQTDPFGDFSRGAQEAEQRTRDLAKATRDQADAFKAEGQRLTEALDPIAKYNAEIERFKKIMDAGYLSQENFRKAVARAQKDMQKAQEQTDKMSDAAKELGLTFTSAFEDAIVSGKKFSDVLRSLGEDILRLLVRKTVTEPGADALSGVFGKILDGILGGPTGGIGGGLGDLGGVGKATALSGLGFFASGGRHGGGFRVVGENGPELEATGPSRIYSASQTADMLGGSSGGTTVYIDARGSNGDAAVEAAVERGIRRAAPGIVGAAVHKVRDGARRDPRMFK